jgi:hypothetical protein
MKTLAPIVRILAGAACATLFGCQTPSGVYQLAEKTTANAGVFHHHLGRLADSSKALAGDRANAVVSMEAFNASLDAYIRRELYMREQSNAGEWPRMNALIAKLTALRDEIMRIEQSARIAENERRQQILAKRTELDTYATSMRETANALSALAQRESAEERVRFIGRFLLDVRADVDEALEKNDKTSKDAKALLGKIKAEFKQDSDQPTR